VLDIVRELVRESRLPVPETGITLDTRFEADLGLDSLGRSELLARVEKALGVPFPEESLLAPTARDLIGFLGSRAGGARVAEAHRLPQATKEGAPESASTLLETLDWHLARHPERVHILYLGSDEQADPISYARLASGAAAVAARLRREGLRPGGTVAVMLPTSPDYFYSFFGILMAGGIPVPIYPPARPQQIEDHLRRHARILDNAGASFLITVEKAQAVARLLRAQVPSLRGVLTLEDEGDGAPALTEPSRPAKEDIAFLQYTSGSTGDPKGVVLSHADLLANIRAMGQAIQVRPDDVFVSWLPLYHDMGLIGAWLGSLYYAIPLVSLSPLAFLARPMRWLRAIHDHRGTLSAAPNFAYELCLSRAADSDLEGLDLSTWRWAFNGAEPVSPQTLRRFADRFARCGLKPEALAPVYGLAEAAVGLAFPPRGRGPRIDCIDRDRFATSGHALPVPCDDPTVMEVVACGQPLPGYRVRVVDQRGRALPDRHEGVLEFQGPSATRGYYRNPEATKRLIRDGWHDTGDRAYVAGGDIHLTGRVKDLIIRGGRNLYPYEIEEAVGAIPGARKGCVVAFAATDPRYGSERLVVVLETKERDPARRAALEQSVRERVSEVGGVPPDEVVLAPPRTVLKTSSGKLRRGAVRDLYLSGRLLAAPPSPRWQLVRVGAAGAAARLSHLARQAPGYLYAAYVWTLFALIAPWVWIGVLAAPRAGWRWALVRGGIRLLRRLAFVRLDVTGRERVPEGGHPLVLVANHQSYLDALMLIDAIERPIAFVAKRELANHPLVGPLLRRLGTLYVERFDLQRSAAETEAFGDALRRGETLGFFPEGTFRDEAGLLPFRMGAFIAAAQSAAPLLPVAVNGTRDLMRGDRLIPRPGKATVAIGEPLTAAGARWEDAAALRDSARAFIAARCGEADLAPSG
jgi:1-acyl-sn-glycerol-3-phosphate acyltransferase